MSDYPGVPVDEYFERQMEDPEYRAAYESLRPIYQLIRRRIDQGLTQAELAERVGTTQSSIARLESGKHKPSLQMLEKVAEALGCKVVMQIVNQDQAA